jgi:glycine/D-amino acid oxidase-like deaminating enzyme
MALRPKVLVVGAGIVGAFVAWHLSRNGARVIVLDATHATGGIASARSFGWINASAGNPEPYLHLRFRAMDEWRRFTSDFPGLAVDWCGGLTWDVALGDMDQFVANHTAWGYQVHRIDSRKIRELEPNLRNPPESAVHAPAEGAAEAGEVARTLLLRAADLGVEIRTATRALSLRVAEGRVVGVRTSGGDVLADETVIAAGLGASQLAASADLSLPMRSSPGMLVISRPLPRIIRNVVMTPEVYARQSPAGRVIASVDFDSEDDATASQLAEAVATDLRKGFRGADLLQVDSYSVTHRPNLIDGLPAIGRIEGVEGVYLAVMHSGVTLAPLVGRFAADEILNSRRDALLRTFGPKRFARACE